MKGKLHKMVSGYILSLNGDIDDPYAIVNKELAEDYGWYRLSHKNCQAIERGYDLDEIKRKLFGGFDGQPDSFTIAAVERTVEIMFEILGDKKFSEEDVLKAIEMYYGKDKIFIEIIQSLQQTEWDVEIEMEKVKDGVKIIGSVKGVKGSGSKIPTYKSIPKLDKNGCLILKRI